MVEFCVDDLNRPRAALQRAEIGPMFHMVAHEQYGALEAEIINGQTRFPEPHSFTEFGKIADYLASRAGVMGRVAYENGHYPELREFVDRAARIGRHILTINPADVIEEGMSSGIVVPFHLYRYVHAIDDPGFKPVAGRRYQDYLEYIRRDPVIEPLDARRQLGAQDLRRLAHQLAWAPNGYLGSASSESYSLYETGVRSLLPFMNMTPGEVVRRDDLSGELSFTKPVLEKKQRDRKRQYSLSPASSGGCPVRHSNFKAAGPFATSMANRTIGNAEVPHQGQTAINKAIDLMATALAYPA